MAASTPSTEASAPPSTRCPTHPITEIVACLPRRQEGPDRQLDQPLQAGQPGDGQVHRPKRQESHPAPRAAEQLQEGQEAPSTSASVDEHPHLPLAPCRGHPGHGRADPRPLRSDLGRDDRQRPGQGRGIGPIGPQGPAQTGPSPGLGNPRGQDLRAPARAPCPSCARSASRSTPTATSTSRACPSAG